MFDTLVTKCVTPKTVTWDTPTLMTLDLGDENGAETYKLQKGALEYLHNKIEVKVSTSKDLFKKSEEMWKQLRDVQLAEAKDKMVEANVFYLEKPTLLYLITDNRDIIDIIDFANKEDFEDFKLKHQAFNLDITTMNNTRKILTEGKGGLAKFICYDKNIDITAVDYTPIVILETNNSKSKYQAYNGILMCDIIDGDEERTVYTIMPALSANLDEKFLSTFIEYFNMEKAIEFATEKAEDLYSAYLEFKKDPIEISAREMTSLCKSLGYKLELDDGDTLHPLENMSDDNNNIKIQQFYNTFKDITGESTYEILQMSDLKRTFRYNRMTLLEMLTILSKEYLTYSGSKITAEVLSDIVYKLYYNKNVDKVQSEDVKNDMK